MRVLFYGKTYVFFVSFFQNLRTPLKGLSCKDFSAHTQRKSRYVSKIWLCKLKRLQKLVQMKRIIKRIVACETQNRVRFEKFCGFYISLSYV